LRDRNSVSYPYVLIWPLAALGHVMLKLAELLCNAGVKITFLNTEEFHDRLIRHRSDVFSRCINLPGFQFKTITDRLPLNHPRISDKLHEYWNGFMSFAIDVARVVGISIFYFRTIRACAFWAYYCIPQIIDAGELPIRALNSKGFVSTKSI
ncbi:hypothetical protein CISIN_1g048768mg, partial [Citrus sinensis]